MQLAAPDRRPLAIALACFAAGLLVVLLALSAGRTAAERRPATAPAIVASVATPAPAASGVPGDPLAQMRTAWRQLLERNERAHVPAAWVAGFYPIYERAQRAFGVNWLLLASVHRQETAFSSHPSTYHGLNFAGCCAGPMQFNVTNGPTTTWERYRDAFRNADRPASYPNPTIAHPSVYDDFDAIMAAAKLLGADGATRALDGAAWQAAYAYYGHDLTGIGYADEVLARAIGWSQHGFSINHPVDPGLRAAVDAAWGAPARAALLPGHPST
jgi:hypothetical protein